MRKYDKIVNSLILDQKKTSTSLKKKYIRSIGTAPQKKR